MRTASDGSYRLTLPAGTYNLGFFDLNRKHPSEYYDDAEQLAQAEDVVVPEGTVVPNIDASLRNPPPPVAEVSTTCNAPVTVDPTSGKVTVGSPNSTRVSHVCDVTLTVELVCPNGATPISPTLVMVRNRRAGVDTKYYPMTESSVVSGTFQATIPAADLPMIPGYWTEMFPLHIEWYCDGEEQQKDVGDVVLYDPSGLITDVDSGTPISNAIVLLHRVPDWRARTDADDTAPQTCESNNSKDAGVAWSQTAPVTQGVFVDAALMALSATQEISPVVNPQITGTDGYYGWDVAAGCWYVEVQAEGYKRVYSPVVGVPPEVTDLHVALGTERFVFLPLITR